jgi:hypothetical protein
MIKKKKIVEERSTSTEKEMKIHQTSIDSDLFLRNSFHIRNQSYVMKGGGEAGCCAGSGRSNNNSQNNNNLIVSQDDSSQNVVNDPKLRIMRQIISFQHANGNFPRESLVSMV